MTFSETQEIDVLESLVPQFEAEGYDVYVNPSPSILPPFMQSHRPDAIALRSDKKIAIEVVRSKESSKPKVRDLQSLFAAHGDWELRVFYASTFNSEKILEIASYRVIQEAIQEVNDLTNDGRVLPALLMAWATLEAIGRALLPVQFRRPQTPERLVEVLASEGYLTPREADILRPVIPLRNAAAHGNLDCKIEKSQVAEFVAILRTLANFLSR